MNKLAMAMVCGALGSLHGLAAASDDLRTLPLEVAGDSGKTVPMGHYLAHLVSAEDANPEAVIAGVHFPMRTRLRSAVLNPADVVVFESQIMATPIFVLGTDKVSIQWLRLNQEKLMHMGAMGVVVQAQSVQEFKALQKLAQGLSLAPVNGDWFENQLLTAGVTVFPVLIQGNGRAIQIVENGGAP